MSVGESATRLARRPVAVRIGGLAVGLVFAAVVYSWAPGPRPAGADDQMVIGVSQEGRPLVVSRVGDGPSSLFIIGGQHGGPEANTVRLAEQLLAHFQEHVDEIPPNLHLDVMTVANPDGLASGARQYASGVDPNRNWGGPDWAADAADSNGVFRPGIGGAEPFSEPETQAERDYILQTDPLFTINYHSRGGFIFGGRTELSGRLADAYADAAGYRRSGAGGARSLLGYRATGSMNVWMGDQGYAAILVELTSSTEAELGRNLAGVRAVLAILSAG